MLPILLSSIIAMNIIVRGFGSLQTQKIIPHELQQQAGQSHELPFVISADAKTPHQAVINALDVASEAGFNQITFAAIQANASEAE